MRSFVFPGIRCLKNMKPYDSSANLRLFPSLKTPGRDVEQDMNTLKELLVRVYSQIVTYAASAGHKIIAAFRPLQASLASCPFRCAAH